MVIQLDKGLWFPDPHWGEDDGLIAVGGDLSVDRLLWPIVTASSPGTASAMTMSPIGTVP